MEYRIQKIYVATFPAQSGHVFFGSTVPAGTAVSKLGDKFYYSQFSSFFPQLNENICFLSESNRPWCVEWNDNYSRITLVHRVTLASIDFDIFGRLVVVM